MNQYFYHSEHNFKNVQLSPIRELQIVNSISGTDIAVSKIYEKCQTFPVIGLDCEWTPTRQKKEKPNVALLQIATRDGFCALFRTCEMDEIPFKLMTLLSDNTIIKVGVGIYNDAQFLKLKYKNLSVVSCFDVRHLVRLCNVYSRSESLQNMTKSFLNFELQKDNVRNYDWKIPLNNEQANYAALDALAGVLIFNKLLPLYHQQREYNANILSDKCMVQKYFIEFRSPCSRYLDRKVKSKRS